MDERDWLAGEFQGHRARLRAVAYRMLGSQSEADDAVQETWLRLSRNGAGSIENLGGWLTTVVGRVCLDMLRARHARREEPLQAQEPGPAPADAGRLDPEEEALLAESVGLALLVVLDTLAPAERVAFVLHDLFDLSFEEIASVLGRQPAAARQLASRARRKVRGAATGSPPDQARQREVVEAYLAAVRSGNLEALLALLDPQVVLDVDGQATPDGVPMQRRGAQAVASGTLAAARGARAARLALVDGAVGVVVAPQGRLHLVLTITIGDGKIRHIDVIADPARLRKLTLALPPG